MSSYIPPSRPTPTEIISTSLFSECSLRKLCIGKAGVYPQTGISGTPAVVKRFRIKFFFSLAKQDLFP